MVVLVFSFWGNPHCLHSGCTDIHFHQHHTRVSISLHPPQHFLLVVFLITATWQVWGSTSLWSWFSNPWWDVEHVFICLLAICIYSLQKCLFVLCPILKSGFGCFSQYILWVLELFWISTSFPMCITCSYLLPLSRLPFSFVDGFPCCVKAFSFDELPFVYFCFCCSCLRRHVKKLLLRPMSTSILPTSSSRSFMA